MRFHLACSNEWTGKSLTGRISDALVGGRWEDALDDLKEMRARGRAPPLGALQVIHFVNYYAFFLKK